MKNIVIVGAGYAGVLTAKKLAKRLKKQENVQITVIDKNPFHTMYTELHEVAAHRVDEDSIKISLERVFAGRNVHVVLDTVTSILTARCLKGAWAPPTTISSSRPAPSRPSECRRRRLLYPVVLRRRGRPAHTCPRPAAPRARPTRRAAG
ncbi:MAG: FAD/NAD(P)-binding protein [Anaerotruncus massiliensis (ex Togo et al. 2019)]